MSDDPWKNFPGGNPFGPNGPFGGGFGGDPFANLDKWLADMGMDPSEFRRMMADMQRSLQDALKQMGDDPSTNFVSGFNVRVGPDGKPRFSTFGNKPTVDTGGGVPVKSGDREPLTDVIDEGATIGITMEMPGVDKQDIDLHMTEDHLEVTVDTEARKYHKRVRLPAKVDASTTKATFKNGILDVTVTKVHGDDRGVRVSVE